MAILFNSCQELRARYRAHIQHSVTITQGLGHQSVRAIIRSRYELSTGLFRDISTTLTGF